jgi:hypothetical protein
MIFLRLNLFCLQHRHRENGKYLTDHPLSLLISFNNLNSFASQNLLEIILRHFIAYKGGKISLSFKGK